MIRPVQYFTDEYLAECQKMSIESRLEYLDNFRRLVAETQSANGPKPKTKLISIKMPEDLLSALKIKALSEGVPYQRLIKNILKKSLGG